MAQTWNRLISAVAIVLMLGGALAACGGGKRTQTTTTVTTARTAPTAGSGATQRTASPKASTGSGVASASGSGTSPAQSAASAAAHGGDQVRSGILVGGVAAAALADNATVNGASMGGSNGVFAGADSTQCPNPYGTQAASDGQFLCSDTGERLACQCDDGRCALQSTQVMACIPTGAVFGGQ